MLAKQGDHPKILSLSEAKGHETGDIGATTKTVNSWQKKTEGGNILTEVKCSARGYAQCNVSSAASKVF